MRETILQRAKGLEKRILVRKLGEHHMTPPCLGRVDIWPLAPFLLGEHRDIRERIRELKRVEGRQGVWESLAATLHQADLLEMGTGNLWGKNIGV